jgi:magnesium chelatase family protein
MGLQGTPVEVEAHATSGLPKFTLIGLPDSVLTEARDRVRAAALNSGVEWPQAVLTVSLSPAWIRKQGSGFDMSRLYGEQFFSLLSTGDRTHQ